MDEAIEEILKREDDSLFKQAEMLEARVKTTNSNFYTTPKEEIQETNRKTDKGELKQRKERRERIISYLEYHQGATTPEIAQALDLPLRITGQILSSMGKWLYDEPVIQNQKRIKRHYLR